LVELVGFRFIGLPSGPANHFSNLSVESSALKSCSGGKLNSFTACAAAAAVVGFPAL